MTRNFCLILFTCIYHDVTVFFDLLVYTQYHLVLNDQSIFATILRQRLDSTQVLATRLSDGSCITLVTCRTKGLLGVIYTSRPTPHFLTNSQVSKYLCTLEAQSWNIIDKEDKVQPDTSRRAV